MTTLLLKSMRDGRGATIGWSIALIATIVMQIAIFPTVRDAAADFQNLLAAYPEAMRAMFSIQDDFATGVGYLHAEMFSLTFPLLALGIAVAHGSAATAREEQQHTMDLLLANPVGRAQLVAIKALAGAVNLVLACAVALGFLIVGADLAGLDVPARDLTLAVAASALLAAVYGALALAVGASTGKRGLAIGVSVGAALLSYLVESLSPLAGWLEPWRVLSPFHHAALGDALRGSPALLGGAVLLTLIVAFTGLALSAFQRRELPV